MMTWNEILAAIFLFLGCLVSLSGSIGLVRLPDFYTRVHASGKTDSLAQFCIFVGLAFISKITIDGITYTVDELTRVKLIMISLLLLVTTPTATHAITKAAFLDGLKPWKRPRNE